MTTNVQKTLIDNISQILKRSLTADDTLKTLREKKMAGFEAIFKKDAGFSCSANTFQPYVEELSNDLLAWQQSQEQQLLVSLVKKIEQLFIVLGNFEASHQD